MTRAVLLTVLLLAIADAGAATGRGRLAHDEAELLSGAALGLPAQARAPISPESILSLDADMRTFVTDRTAGGDDASKLNRLVDGMRELGLFALDYTLEETLTAQASFHDQRGNCLSFTLLFVVLAREAGLDARYQVVDVPPTWSEQSELVVTGRHVDALVDIPHNGRYVVDFNGKDFEPHYSHRIISDEHALALFYNNLGAEALLRRDYTRAFLHLRTALGRDPKLSGAWANLGLLYWRIAHGDLAEAAYLKALSLDPDNGSALTNLASLYSQLRRTELAAEYRLRVEDYQRANPYYHYALAERAYEEERFEDTLRALRDAIRRKRDDPRFYALQGRAYLGLGLARNAEKSFERAREHSRPGDAPAFDGETATLGADSAALDAR